MITRNYAYNTEHAPEQQFAGRNAELQFANLFPPSGWKVTQATFDQDRTEHWDILVEKGDLHLKIDVKDWKRSMEYGMVVLETGKFSWMEGGNSHIAFKLTPNTPYDWDSWLVVSRKDLQSIIDNNSFADGQVGVYTAFTKWCVSGDPRPLYIVPLEIIEFFKIDMWGL